jgi:ribosomal protein S7
MHKKDSNYGNINVHSPVEVADNGKKDIFMRWHVQGMILRYW